MEQNNELQVQPTNTGIAIFDGGSFEHMYRVAKAMSAGSLIPQTLQGSTPEETTANCLRVVEQAQRWGFSPFAVMDHASVVHGKLMWEGKLVSAALDATLGIKLKYQYSGDGQQRKVVVSGEIDGEAMTVEGTVAGWKTTKAGSPWDKAGQHDQMLAYRGAREWTRRYAPSAILGVYTTDEMEFTKPATRNVTKPAQTINPFAGRTPQIETKTEPVAEEKPAEVVEPVKEEPKPAKKAAKKAAKKKDLVTVVGKILDYNLVEGVGKDSGKPYRYHAITLQDEDGQARDVNTFSDTIGGLADFNKGCKCRAELEATPKGIKIVSLELVEEEA